MTYAREVDLRDVLRMVEHCAKGNRQKQGDYRVQIQFNGLTYQLPHGEKAQKTKLVETGHVRKMVKFLGILPSCADEQLPLLAGMFGVDPSPP
ncbi:MAG: hypothetical protein ACREQY_09265 [Candidatus Binatia bacterium]